VQVPAPFDYERATSVDQAVALLERLGPEARVVAGGHSLLPMMKLRLAAPEHLVDINDLHDLAYLREEGGEVRIGALTRHRELLESAALAEHFPIFAEAERVIADPVVRNRGTIGGSLCQGDPAEDLSAVCTALGASVVIRGSHQGPYETAVGAAELLVEVRIPIREHHGSAYEKVERRAGDWAIAAVGAAVWMDGGTIADAGIALAAVGPTTVHARNAEAALRGQAAGEDVFTAAAIAASDECSPADDQRGPAVYKRHLVRELTLRAVRRATARALHQEA
jgi:carbon-monoxide dehydrogenase medium subunit